MTAPSVAERKWMSGVAAMGCVACRMRLGVHEPTTVHHLTSGGRRLGHFFTIPLCPWHHQGYVRRGLTSTKMAAIFGPSLAKSREDFEREFGTELELLESIKTCPGLQPNPA